MDDKKISLLSAKPGKLDALVEAVPDLFGKLKELKSKMSEKKGDDNTGPEMTESGIDEDTPDNPTY